MLKLFGKNAFTRKCKARAMLTDCVSAIESLEDRVVLASQVTTFFSNGSLFVYGSGFADNIVVTFDGTNKVSLTSPGNVTAINGAGAGPFVVTGDLSISLGNQDDTLQLAGINAAKLDSGNLLIDMGSGADTIALQAGDIILTGDLSVIGGTGDDFLQIGSAAGAFEVQNITVDSGADFAESVFLDNVTAHGNVSITNRGTGPQVADLGTLAPNAISGNLVITQSNPLNTGGYGSHIIDTSVTGNVTVTNGNGNGNAVVQITSSGAIAISGTTTVTNGNNDNNSVDFQVTGGGTLTLARNITVKNGTAGTDNEITVNGLVTSATTAATFTNGNADSNAITLGDSAANQFLGSLTLTNADAGTTTNDITIDQTTVAKTVNLTNGSALTDNSVTIGATAGVTLSANTVIKNGAGTGSDNVLISRLSAGAGVTPGGNVTISNAASGATNVTLGGAGANTIAGNLLITNMATTGARLITLNATNVNGRTGVSINDSGAGTSTVNVGTTAPGVVIVGQLNIQDATGNSTVNLRRLTAGSLEYNDLGGGSDTLQIASQGVGTVQINGITRLNTGAGSDSLTIGTSGVAIFNDSVFVSLGAGNDTVTIGAAAASPAFSSASKYQFDGGAGDDSFTADALSLSAYQLPLPAKLKSKITSFEHPAIT